MQYPYNLLDACVLQQRKSLFLDLVDHLATWTFVAIVLILFI